MGETNLMEAFGAYKAKPVKLGRSALTDDGVLVLSCWYTRFQKAEAGVLRYEEDLAEQTGSAVDRLRAHLAEALEHHYEICLIVAVEPVAAKTQELGKEPSTRPKPTSFHARKDLRGRVVFYDGKKFVIEFRKAEAETASA